jgi:general secretion pathway protein A
VTVNCHLDGLNEEEVEQYIHYRLKVGGAKSDSLFDKDAIKKIFKYSGGIPRLINVICDAALVYGYADNLKIIDDSVVANVVKEREDGGLFADVREDDVIHVSPDQSELPGANVLTHQLSDLDRRLRLIENRIDGFDQRLHWLAKKKEDRDTVVIELFKMLKDSMEKRIQTLIKIQRTK